jgi:formate hydrogenlyase transcriptional activator
VEGSETVRVGEQKEREREFARIVGKSPALEAVLEQVERVAPTDSTVLIQGETGTGKELIAQAIHNVSRRYGRPYVKLNCAAIPFDLLESELFGHERGAFTGAIAQKIGRFDLADQGTLFLDEVGDIPLALQPKLLRVLQEQEFERLGGGKTHRVNVRLVAATHRNLAEMVARQQFRSDLYYRLDIYPIFLPPLRERREDIPLLVWHFVDAFSRRINKQIHTIPKETMDAFTSYSWPGNVRELQNLIERGVICSDNGVFANPFPPLDVAVQRLPAPNFTGENQLTSDCVASPCVQDGTFKDSERAVILRALDAAGWIVGGPRGAAARLALKRTTLISKMKKLGISRPLQQIDVGEMNGNHEGHQPWQPAAD